MWDDYGAIGVGASLAHYVLAENGNEYIIKGPTFTPNHRYVAANELIAARIAGTLGLPVLDHCVVEMAGRFYFGSAWMQKPTFYPNTTADNFVKCENQERAYDIVVFDILVCNVDRHGGNLLVRRSKDGRHLVLMNDHSHCMVLPGEDASVLVNRVAASPRSYLGLPFIRDAISDINRLRQAVELLTSIGNDDIVRVVNAMPEEFLASADRGLFKEFLQARRDALAGLIGSNLALFPNLNGSTL